MAFNVEMVSPAANNCNDTMHEKLSLMASCGGKAYLVMVIVD